MTDQLILSQGEAKRLYEMLLEVKTESEKLLARAEEAERMAEKLAGEMRIVSETFCS